jgi:hypothetical protein
MQFRTPNNMSLAGINLSMHMHTLLELDIDLVCHVLIHIGRERDRNRAQHAKCDSNEIHDAERVGEGVLKALNADSELRGGEGLEGLEAGAGGEGLNDAVEGRGGNARVREWLRQVFGDEVDELVLEDGGVDCGCDAAADGAGLG